MGTHCAPLTTDLFLFYNERNYMISPFDDTKADVIEALNSTFRYLVDF